MWTRNDLCLTVLVLALCGSVAGCNGRCESLDFSDDFTLDLDSVTAGVETVVLATIDDDLARRQSYAGVIVFDAQTGEALGELEGLRSSNQSAFGAPEASGVILGGEFVEERDGSMIELTLEFPAALPAGATVEVTYFESDVHCGDLLEWYAQATLDVVE